MDADLRSSLGNDNPTFRADGVNLDFADVRVARRADATDAKRADDAVVKFQRNSGKIIHVVIDIGLMEMCPGAGENSPHIHAGEHADIAERVDAFDLQFAHRLDANPAIRAVGVGLNLAFEPVDRQVAGLPGALGRAGVF